MSEIKLRGTPLSPGLSYGYAFTYKTIPFEQRNIVIKAEDVEKELSRLNEAIKKTRESLEKLKDRTKKKLGEEKAGIIEAHMLMLEDHIVLGHGDAEILDMEIKNSKIVGKKVKDVSPTENYIIVAIYSNGDLMIPQPDMVLERGAKISVLVKSDAVNEATKRFTG